MTRAQLGDVAARPAPEIWTTQPSEAIYESASGERCAGGARVTVTRAALSLALVPAEAAAFETTAYGAAGGRVVAGDGAWEALDVKSAGPSARHPGTHRFACARVRVAGAGNPRDVAATGLAFAGAAWAAEAAFEGRPLLVRPLSEETTSYEDDRLAATVAGALDEATVQTLRRLFSFVSGVDLALLSVARYDAAGTEIDREHRREPPKIGSSTHSPFAGVVGRDRDRALGILSDGFARVLRTGFPFERVVDLVTRSNVGYIHIAAQLYALAIETTVEHLGAPGGAGAPRRERFARVLRELGLDLDAAALERLLTLRRELLRQGYFHREYRSMQQEIKFLRDVAHTIVLRLCGYSGPFYSSAGFRVVELPDAPVAV